VDGYWTEVGWNSDGIEYWLLVSQRSDVGIGVRIGSSMEADQCRVTGNTYDKLSRLPCGM